MSIDDFNKLPELVRGGAVKKLLNLNDRDLRALRESKPEIVVNLPGQSQPRYRRRLVAEMVTR